MVGQVVVTLDVFKPAQKCELTVGIIVSHDHPAGLAQLREQPAQTQKGTEPITVEDVQAVVADGATTVTRILSEAARLLA